MDISAADRASVTLTTIKDCAMKQYVSNASVYELLNAYIHADQIRRHLK